MFEEGVKVFAEVGADALAQRVVEPIEILLVDQPVTKHPKNLVNPQPADEIKNQSSSGLVRSSITFGARQFQFNFRIVILIVLLRISRTLAKKLEESERGGRG